MTEAKALGLEVIDRCNLTVLQEPGQEDLVDFLAQHRVWFQRPHTLCHCLPIHRRCSSLLLHLKQSILTNPCLWHCMGERAYSSHGDCAEHEHGTGDHTCITRLKA